RLVEELQPTRSLARHPLFQVMLTFQNAHQESAVWELPGLQAQPHRLGGAVDTAKFDLSFNFAELRGGGAPAGIDILISYAADLFEHATGEDLLQRLVRVVDTVAADPTIRVSGGEMLEAGERRRIVVEWNSTEVAVPELAVSDLFEAQVKRSPDAVAAIFEGVQLTYAGLEAAANRLAWYLIERGVGPGALVAIALPRSLELITALLGVLKAGAAYLPLDQDYPAARIEFMM